MVSCSLNLDFFSFCRLTMTDLIYSHILLSETLCFAEDKARSDNAHEKSKFLSSLALLLNGDAACTAVYVNQTEKTILIARNEPTSTQDHRYFNHFFALVRIYSNICFDREKDASSKDAKNLLRSVVYKYNAKKIIKRFTNKKAAILDRLKQLVDPKTDQTPFIDELRSKSQVYRHKPAITEKLHLISKNRNDEEYVQHLFQEIKRFLIAYDQLIKNQANPTDEQFNDAICSAVELYQSRLFLFILKSIEQRDGDGVYYFEKISAHMRSLNLILKCLLSRRSDLGEIYKNITWKLIPAVQKEAILNVTPKKAFEILFENCAPKSFNTLENLTSEEFYDKHLKRMSSYDENRRISMHVHAEILLVDYLLNNGINQTSGLNDVEIGISKMPCLLCCYYISELNKKCNRYFFPSQWSNGKIYGKWLLRDAEDSSIIESINEKLVEKLKRAIQKLCLDSNRSGPHKSGDSDVMFASVEVDEYDQEFSQSRDEKFLW